MLFWEHKMFHDIRLVDVKAETMRYVDFYRVYIWATEVCSPLWPAHCMHVQPLICKELSWAELAHSPVDFDKVLHGHAVFLSHVKDFSCSQHANVSNPKMVANNYCSLSQSHSVMLTNKFTIFKFTLKKEKKQLQFILFIYNMMIGWS